MTSDGQKVMSEVTAGYATGEFKGTLVYTISALVHSILNATNLDDLCCFTRSLLMICSVYFVSMCHQAALQL